MFGDDISRSALLRSPWGAGQYANTSSYGMMPGAVSGPTIGSLADAIMHDASIDAIQKQMAIQQLQSMAAGMPEGTPLSTLIFRMGGGLLGFLVAKYFKMGPVGQVLATTAGYGIGRMFTQAAPRDPWSNVQ